MNPEYMSVADAAKYLTVSRTTFEACLHTQDPNDHIPHARYGTKRIVRRIDLDAWIERHMEEA